MTKKIVFVTILFILFINTSFSQSFNKWEVFTDMKNIRGIAVKGNKYFAATSGGLFFYEPASEKYTKFTNLNGLVNIDLTSIILDSQDKLWIGASDGSIVLMDLNGNIIKDIFDIKNSTETNKSINYFYQYGNNMFVATGYGIQKIDVNTFNFIDAPYYQLGILPIKSPVTSLTVNRDTIFAATKGGVAYTRLINNNLNNPSSWSSYVLAPLNANVNTIESYLGNVFAGSETGFAAYIGGSWAYYPNTFVSTLKTTYVKAIDQKMYFVTAGTVYSVSNNDLVSLTPVFPVGTWSVIQKDNSTNPIYGTSDKGLYYNTSSGYTFKSPNGPFTSVFDNITIDAQDHLWVAGGSAAAGIYKYDGSSWTNYNITDYPALGNNNTFRKIVYANDKIYALSFGGGVCVINGNDIKNYNPSNSILPGFAGNPNFCVPFGGAADNKGNFWTTFYSTNSSKSLYVLTPDTNWVGFFNPPYLTAANLSQIAVDNYNTKWVVSENTSPSGLYFFNENNTLTNFDDDISGFYNVTEFPGGSVTNCKDVIVEKNGEVWVATNNGVFIIANPLAAIQNPNNKPPLVKLGIISGNLKVPFTENCISIKSDILNEKWVGTASNGVFNFSEDGTTLIAQYTTKNSPLLDDKVNTIAISNKTGKANFGTLKGLSVLQTSAVEPVADFDKIICSPNPFVVPSSVSLNIDGLVENSVIKIITLDGQVVTEFDSPGGRIAKWNGLNKNGKNVPTGIYMVVAYSQNGGKVGVGKVAIIRNAE